MSLQPKQQTPFSAGDPALGYLYQVRLALLLALERLPQEEDGFFVYLETLDDVVFKSKGTPAELLQLKHHKKKDKNLTDRSEDLWKSLRVWIEGRKSKAIPHNAKLFLITTRCAGKRSLVQYLLKENRDETEAINRLRKIVTPEESKKQKKLRRNEKIYELFRNLKPEEQTELVHSITIFPDTPNITDLDRKLQSCIYYIAPRDHQKSLLEGLEGWWYRRSIQCIDDPSLFRIYSGEIDSKIKDLREEYHTDSLPIYEDIFGTEVDKSEYEKSIFVEQAKLAKISEKRILTAIRDYYRAFEQRSRWLREELLYISDLEKYERRLKEQWEIAFDRITDELGVEAAESAKIKAAKKIYAWMEDQDYPLRPRMQESSSITRGSFQILSEKLDIGWHPDFEARIKRLLELPEVS